MPKTPASETPAVHAPGVFRFRRFDVRHERSAMKVGTDGVLLGAWCSLPADASVWDVGAGTGLIALMLAQRGAGRVEAIEIDAVAAEEARHNVALSPWPGIVNVVTGDFTEVEGSLPAPDLIVSNPPFFNEALQSPEQMRATARHEGSLTFGTLFDIAAERLTPDGRLACIAPAPRVQELLFEATLRRLSLHRLTNVATVAGKAPKRVLLEFGRQASATDDTTLTIRSDGKYTDEYRRLTSDFYLTETFK